MHSAPSAKGGIFEESAETKWLSLSGRERKQDAGMEIQLVAYSSRWKARSPKETGGHT